MREKELNGKQLRKSERISPQGFYRGLISELQSRKSMWSGKDLPKRNRENDLKIPIKLRRVFDPNHLIGKGHNSWDMADPNMTPLKGISVKFLVQVNITLFVKKGI